MQIVYNSTVRYEGSDFRYEDLCAKWDGYCYDNQILRLAELIPSIEVGEINITYPVYFNPDTFEAYTLPAYFGGIQVSDKYTVEKVDAVSLTYFLDVSEEWRRKVGDRWSTLR